jgi:hypothetical protein
MKIAVLFPVEKIQHCRRHPRQLLKVSDRRGVHIHSADAAEPSAQPSHLCTAAVETTRSSESAEQLKVADLDFRDTDIHLASPPISLSKN